MLYIRLNQFVQEGPPPVQCRRPNRFETMKKLLSVTVLSVLFIVAVALPPRPPNWRPYYAMGTPGIYKHPMQANQVATQPTLSTLAPMPTNPTTLGIIKFQ